MFLSQVRSRQAGIVNANTAMFLRRSMTFDPSTSPGPGTKDARRSSATSYSTTPDPWRGGGEAGCAGRFPPRVPGVNPCIECSIVSLYRRFAERRRGRAGWKRPRRRDALIYGRVTPCSNTGNKDTVGFSRIYALTIQNGERLPGFSLARVIRILP